MSERPVVFLDDDARDSIQLDLESVGYGRTKLELQDLLRQKGFDIPTIIISGHGDVPMAVRAMKAGALDFLCKPVSGQSIIEIVDKAFASDSDRRCRATGNAEIMERLDSLTPREREVLEHLLEGLSSREIADTLGVIFKTIEAHRANITRKMQTQNVAHLIRMVKDVMFVNNNFSSGK